MSLKSKGWSMKSIFQPKWYPKQLFLFSLWSQFGCRSLEAPKRGLETLTWRFSWNFFSDSSKESFRNFSDVVSEYFLVNFQGESIPAKVSLENSLRNNFFQDILRRICFGNALEIQLFTQRLPWKYSQILLQNLHHRFSQ